MRNFYEITFDSNRDDLMVLERDELGTFDIRCFWHGQRLGGQLPVELELYVNASKAALCDYVANYLSWSICSQRLVDLFLSVAQSDIEVVNAPLIDSVTNSRIPGYGIINVLSIIECLDMNQSVFVRGNLIELVLKKSKIPKTTNIFRPAESPYAVLVSEEVVASLRGQGFTGLALIARQAL
jgi:hypothetical protein